MIAIGVTGGVGAGKTTLLTYLREHYNCRVILADQVANRLKEPGQRCYGDIVALLGKDVLNQDKTIDRQKMAGRIFEDRALLEEVNRIIHPAVKEYILEEIQKERDRGELDFVFVEAALLIEEGYGALLDDMWYIHADKEARARRLGEGRQYSHERIQRLLDAQLTEQAYREHCPVEIDNSGTPEEAFRQMETKMGEYLWKK